MTPIPPLSLISEAASRPHGEDSRITPEQLKAFSADNNKEQEEKHRKGIGGKPGVGQWRV
jgi:hypothetical protein